MSIVCVGVVFAARAVVARRRYFPSRELGAGSRRAPSERAACAPLPTQWHHFVVRPLLDAHHRAPVRKTCQPSALTPPFPSAPSHRADRCLAARLAERSLRARLSSQPRLRATTLYCQSLVSRDAHRTRHPASKHWTGPPPRCGASRRARAPPWQAVLAWHHHLPSPITLLPRLVSAARAVCRISSPGTGSSASLAACRAVCSINLRPQRPKQTSETDSDQTSLRAQAR